MNVKACKSETSSIAEISEALRKGASAKKCLRCGCFHDAIRAVRRVFPDGSAPVKLREAVRLARESLAPPAYDCLGCNVCHAALVMNTIGVGLETAEAKACTGRNWRQTNGWPPLPGDYTALRYSAPVAVCTLTDKRLVATLAERRIPDMAIIGTLQTENLGIERLIVNILTNPNIRFLILCGGDSHRAIGHLPGQSLTALLKSGLDESSRIIGARGKQPFIRNVSRAAVEHFRRSVELVELIGCSRLRAIIEAAGNCAYRNPGPAAPFFPERTVRSCAGHLPRTCHQDPSGYFVIFPDRPRHLLMLEHYTKKGLLDTVITGASTAELYTPAIEKGLVSRLDHAAYLGRELARAEHALESDIPYIQDAAPGRLPRRTTSCGCNEGRNTRRRQGAIRVRSRRAQSVRAKRSVETT